MRICLQCTAQMVQKKWDCPECGWSPEVKDGFPILAPYLVGGFPDYPLEAHSRLVHLDANNFWFLCRNQLITQALDRFFPQAQNFLEIGCGTGFVLSGISQAFPKMRIFGAEAYLAALKYAKQRLAMTEFAQMDAYRLPFVEEFNVIGAFDVLEHLDNDELALQEIHRSTKRGGGVILTVPQHQWLWSPLDEKAGHKRRYTRRELRYKMETAGFEVLFMTSFVMFLLPLMLLSRWIKSRQRFETLSEVRNELELSRLQNAIFKYICSLDVFLIQKGFSLPVGGTLLCVARKKVLQYEQA